ncbi:TonB-dependent receptor [Daejeonella lutea]|uniref:Outer membrane receptor proteins, mostly Fe transport n=1 Tax=Daejeonella lutea TaxID=572036 RepID=A0A1T5CW89_9SPHI|nr:TonB-dependent receptor [Daejeonella lutea]SKB63699.1 Outer membrane receptor proteins, mostly Fe transport [Daejeonella lutea]
MKKLTVLTVLPLLCLFSGMLYAQKPTITGRLVTTQQAPLTYATITLQKAADSSFVSAILSDTTGRFAITAPAAGSYVLKVSTMGYKTHKTAPFTVSPEKPGHDHGDILISQDSRSLGEVSVTAMRPTLIQKADRMVLNVEGTAMASGNSAYTVLGRAPGVFIDQQGNIQLNGRPGVTVMLDGKLTYLSAADLRNLLESMPAENIKNIEIITNPSAKYDAEGASGILNINLKKNDLQGINGSISAGYIYNGRQHAWNTGATLNFKKGRFNSFANLDAARRVGGREATFTRIFYSPLNTTYFDQTAVGNFASVGPPRVRLGSDYSIDKNHLIGFVAGYNRNSAKSDFLTETLIGAAPNNPGQFIDADNVLENTYRNFTTNLHYAGKLDTAGSSLSADLDYVSIANRGASWTSNYFTNLLVPEPVITEFLYSDTPNDFDIYSGKIDYTRALSKSAKFETGGRISSVVTAADSKFYFNNGGLTPDPKRSNEFNYRENIYAAYINFQGTLSPKLNVQAGLRAEQTDSRGESPTTGQVTDRSYLNLFPSVFLQHKVTPNYDINYSYSRRLQRPNYGNLNPFIFYRDPYTYIEGNPYLRPQYAHSLSVTQVFKKTYNLVLSYQLTNDIISELLRIDPTTNTTIYYNGNVNTGHDVSLSGNGPIKIAKNWDTSNTLYFAYTDLNLENGNGPQRNRQFTYMAQSNHTVGLLKDIRMELNLLYRGPGVSGLYRVKAMNRVDLGFKKSFLNKKLDLSVNAPDIFKSYRLRFDSTINGNINNFDQYFRSRTIGASLRYNFSKGQKVDIRKSSAVEEVNRT